MGFVLLSLLEYIEQSDIDNLCGTSSPFYAHRILDLNICFSETNRKHFTN